MFLHQEAFRVPLVMLRSVPGRGPGRAWAAGRQLLLAPTELSTPKDTGNSGTLLHGDLNQSGFSPGCAVKKGSCKPSAALGRSPAHLAALLHSTIYNDECITVAE